LTMDSAEIILKSAGPSGSSYAGSRLGAGKRSAPLAFPTFMLRQPEPTDVSDDVRAARAAMEESGQRISYEEVRRKLGLE
jgi:hypothetical protein